MPQIDEASRRKRNFSYDASFVAKRKKVPIELIFIVRKIVRSISNFSIRDLILTMPKNFS